MAKTEVVHARVEPKVKKQAEAVFKMLGLTTSDAISMFLRQVALNDGIPFSLNVPNKKTAKVIRDARAGKNVKTFDSFDSFLKDLKG